MVKPQPAAGDAEQDMQTAEECIAGADRLEALCRWAGRKAEPPPKDEHAGSLPSRLQMAATTSRTTLPYKIIKERVRF
jgi:hypothetical protein